MWYPWHRFTFFAWIFPESRDDFFPSSFSNPHIRVVVLRLSDKTGGSGKHHKGFCQVGNFCNVALYDDPHLEVIAFWDMPNGARRQATEVGQRGGGTAQMDRLACRPGKIRIITKMILGRISHESWTASKRKEAVHKRWATRDLELTQLGSPLVISIWSPQATAPFNKILIFIGFIFNLSCCIALHYIVRGERSGVAVISAKNHKCQRRKRQSITAKREK